MVTHPHRLHGSFSVDSEGVPFLDCNRVRLLEAIDDLGSIAKAARQLPMSYKAAWDALNVMGTQAGRPLVTRTVGGAGGGGSRLTEHGRELIALYQALEEVYEGAISRLANQVDDPVTRTSSRCAPQRRVRRASHRSDSPLRQPAGEFPPNFPEGEDNE